MPTKRLFSDWNKEELEQTFGLIRVYHHALLDQWFQQSQAVPVTNVEQEIVANLRQVLFENTDVWNETELMEYFISPLLSLVNFNTPEFKIFSDRPLSGIVGDYELYGEPDAVIAKGRYSPQIPYFCFHEYKKALDPKGDPAAQSLSAMLVAQELTQRRHPVYGMYVVGEHWYFMVLQEDTYCISTSFSANDEQVFDVFKILKALKRILLEIAAQDASWSQDGAASRNQQSSDK